MRICPLLPVVAALLCSCGREAPHESAVVFVHEVIDSEGIVDPWLKAVGDLNADGRPDLVAGYRTEGGLVWYENPGWKKHVIDVGKFSTDGEVADLDRDGDPDIVAITAEPDSLLWYENPGWKKHVIDTRQLHDVDVADFNGDGLPDLVARNQGAFSSKGDELHFYLQEGPGRWRHHAMAIADGEGLAVADMDGDGDADVVVERVWYENTGDPAAKPWPAHEYGPDWRHPYTFVAVGDLNGDGRPDIVLAPSERAGGTYRISWFEAPPDPKSARWIEHVVEAEVETVHHFIGVGDFAGDGAADIATAQMQQGKDPDEVSVYFNLGGGRAWRKQVLSEAGSHSMRIADLDGDGRLDLYGGNWRGRTVEVWWNRPR